MTRGSNPPHNHIRHLGFVVGVFTLMSTSSLAQTPESIELAGVVRDFRNGFPDFKLEPQFIYSHSAGNLAMSLDSAGKPMYQGGGFLVDSQWMNDSSQPIAPHLFGIGGGMIITGGALICTNEPTLYNNPTLDTYDPTLGAYGDPNIGPAPEMQIGAAMPSMPPMPDLGASTGDMTYAKNGTTTISSSFQCNSIIVRNRHRLQIDGDVTIIVSGMFSVENNTDIVLLDGASLELFLLGEVNIENHVFVNYNTADHTRLTINYAGSAPFVMPNNCHIYGTLLAPHGMLAIENNADFYGSVTAHGVSMVNAAGLHIAGGAAQAACFEPDDLEGAAGNQSTGIVTGGELFAQWFRTVPGENVAIAHSIAMPADDQGVFTYSVFDFTPINFQGFGNDWGHRNRAFTFEGRGLFTGRDCSGYFLEFTGAGDVWVFIDGELVMDLGGAPTEGRQLIEIDRLGLTPAEDHVLKFFYAQRVHTVAPFTLRTNIPLRTDSRSLPSATALSD